MVQTRGKNNRKFKFYIAAFAFVFKTNYSIFQFFWVGCLKSLLAWYAKIKSRSRISPFLIIFIGPFSVLGSLVLFISMFNSQFYFFYRLPQPGEVDRLFWVTYYFRILLLFIIMNLLLTTKSIKLEMELLWHQRQSKHLKTYSNVITLI